MACTGGLRYLFRVALHGLCWEALKGGTVEGLGCLGCSLRGPSSYIVAVRIGTWELLEGPDIYHTATRTHWVGLPPLPVPEAQSP